MNYADATRYLISLGNEVRASPADGVQAAKLGLENIRILLGELGQPQDAYPSVLIAGTNGKGSVAAMLEAVLQSGGLRTGLYTSPHLVEICERIQLGGEAISPEDFAAAFTSLRDRIEALLAAGTLQFHPTYFECLTAMAMDYFRQRRGEFAVLEVGMGGRLDATNTASPCVSVITQIDFDHERFLGNTIAAIAGEKAGIIKPGGVVVSGASLPQAAAVIRRVSRECNARLVESWKEYAAEDLACEDGFYRFRASHADGYSALFRLSLRGRHQVENALTVVAASRELARLGYPVSQASLAEGLATGRWPGRLEQIHAAPRVFLDGAHNPAGARALANYWEEHCAGRRIVLVYGAMRDKAVPEIVEILFPRAAAVVLTRPEQTRAAQPETLREIGRHLNANLVIEPSPLRALDRALELADTDAFVFVTGSLFLVGDVKRSWKSGHAQQAPGSLAASLLR
jgi:dihydrofolate synthase/folylpolyglutamate synthase